VVLSIDDYGEQTIKFNYKTTMAVTMRSLRLTKCFRRLHSSVQFCRHDLWM
jgi:hypothetical protein